MLNEQRVSDETKPKKENLLNNFLNQNNVDLDKLGFQVKDMTRKIKSITPSPILQWPCQYQRIRSFS